jgi:hypothetical protein
MHNKAVVYGPRSLIQCRDNATTFDWKTIACPGDDRVPRALNAVSDRRPIIPNDLAFSLSTHNHLGSQEPDQWPIGPSVFEHWTIWPDVIVLI